MFSKSRNVKLVKRRHAMQKRNKFITAVVSNKAGEIFDLDGYAAVGMAGSSLVSLALDDTMNMPFGTELLLMPDRKPIVYNIRRRRMEILKEDPYRPGEPVFPVAAFNSPGYVISFVSAYEENESAGFLPLFSYGAVGWHNGKFRSAAILVDREKRQDLRRMKPEDVAAGIRKIQKEMTNNRLEAHLEKCAVEFGCPAAKNFFIGRYEAPLPTSSRCNAKCLGCLSLQKSNRIPHSQDRIAFKPTSEEISEVALFHINRVKHCVVSFGQGCEGDPLMAADVIEPAIKLIRSRTRQGTINMNTNGSQPKLLKKLFTAGLDSIRISLNSVRRNCYDAYFRPSGYTFVDVTKSIENALIKHKFVSINYLNCPGFTDTPEEMEALMNFIDRYPINMIQWRNLNFDPRKYWGFMSAAAGLGMPMGMHRVIREMKASFPDVKHGYFNPPKENF
jgi:pyruvate-formate lyase-activating enzyme